MTRLPFCITDRASPRNERGIPFDNHCFDSLGGDEYGRRTGRAGPDIAFRIKCSNRLHDGVDTGTGEARPHLGGNALAGLPLTSQTAQGAMCEVMGMLVRGRLGIEHRGGTDR